MKSESKKFVILATGIALIWLCFLIFTFFRYTSYSEIVEEEIQLYSRNVAEQVVGVFEWFNERQEVFVAKNGKYAASVPTHIGAMNLGGGQLKIAVPIELVEKIQNEFENRVNIRLVSNSPKNYNNLPTAVDNIALMNLADQGKPDAFFFNDEKKQYQYVRPLFAGKSCLTCHTDLVQENALIGAVVVDSNPKTFTLSTRASNYQLINICLVGSSVLSLVFYFFMLAVWRKQSSQTSDLSYSQAMVSNMGQGLEVIAGNMERIIKELEQESDHNSQRHELLRTLQNMTQGLVQQSSDINDAKQAKKMNAREDLIEIDAFLKRAMQIFQAKCEEKGISLSLDVDAAVPEYVLGDEFNLTQLLASMIKNAVDNTDRGGVQIRIKSTASMSVTLDSRNLDTMPIHLIMEVEDTSKGYILKDQSKYLQGHKAKKFNNRLNQQPIIDLQPISELAQFLNGSLSVARNTKNGACFVASSQVKLVSKDMLPQKASQEIVQNTTVGRAIVASASSGAVATDSNVGRTNMTSASGNTVTSDSSSVISSASGSMAASFPDSIVASATSAMQKIESDHDNKPAPHSQALDIDLHAPPSGPISVIIGDSGISELKQEAVEVFAKEKLNVQLMSEATQIFAALDSPNHGYSVVLLRELNDYDTTYTATRIRYLERLGSTPVAVVLIAEDIVSGDMEVLRFFNVSTVDKFPRDPNILAKVVRLVMHTRENKIFQSGKFIQKTEFDGIKDKIYDEERALENAKQNKELVRSVCSMFVRFYPEQLRRLRGVIKNGSVDEKMRVMRAIRNSAGTVSLPLLWREATRIEEKLDSGDEDIRFEKLISLYDQSYECIKKTLSAEQV